MTKLNSVYALVSGLVLSAALGFNAQADDAAVRQSLEAAKALFNQRSAASSAPIDQALASLKTLEGQAQAKELKYDVLILEARALYFKGTHTAGDAGKKTVHEEGRAKADAAEALGLELAEAPFFAGLHLARWGEANGVVSSVSQVPTLKKYMAKATDRVTRDDKEGETVDGFGPSRILGRMYKKLPGLLGGSHSESVKLLDKAYKGAPTTALNAVYLADTLLKDGNAAEQTEGKAILAKLLARDAATLNPDRVVETTEEFELARQVQAGKDIN
jgi:hypothetical protein